MNTPPFDFKGKRVLVTGGSRGLGAALCAAFARCGAYVYINFRQREREARRVLDEIWRTGGDGETISFDVRSNDAVRSGINAICADKGLDILVNNAAVVWDAPFPVMVDEAWRAVLQTNLDGAYHCSRAVVPHLLAARSGVILNVCSVAGIRGAAGQCNYAASKGAVLGMTKSLARELSGKGIRVNAISPGLMESGMTQRMPARARAELMKNIPLKYPGKADHFTGAALFLCSSMASYITGQNLVVDGGLSL